MARGKDSGQDARGRHVSAPRQRTRARPRRITQIPVLPPTAPPSGPISAPRPAIPGAATGQAARRLRASGSIAGGPVASQRGAAATCPGRAGSSARPVAGRPERRDLGCRTACAPPSRARRHSGRLGRSGRSAANRRDRPLAPLAAGCARRRRWPPRPRRCHRASRRSRRGAGRDHRNCRGRAAMRPGPPGSRRAAIYGHRHRTATSPPSPDSTVATPCSRAAAATSSLATAQSCRTGSSAAADTCNSSRQESASSKPISSISSPNDRAAAPGDRPLIGDPRLVCAQRHRGKLAPVPGLPPAASGDAGRIDAAGQRQAGPARAADAPRGCPSARRRAAPTPRFRRSRLRR